MNKDKIKIILLEDDQDDIYLFKQAIRDDEKISPDIIVFNSINDLISTKDHGCDVIILDLGLPDSQGLKSLIIVSNHFHELPLIVLTGTDNNQLGEQAIQLGAQDYIPKSDLSKNIISRSIRFSIERNGLISKMKNMAHVDPLTLLYNRAYFNERLDQQISISQRSGEQFAIMMIDLDGFKEINDTLGHQAGDQVLSQISARLRSSTRQSDVLARFGGDEFVILLSSIKNEFDCEQSAENKLKCRDHSFLIFSHDKVHKVDIGMSIGISIFPDHGQSSKKLIECADDAMYKVKESGKNSYKIFTEV